LFHVVHGRPVASLALHSISKGKSIPVS
jgi:hypothetical protein